MAGEFFKGFFKAIMVGLFLMALLMSCKSSVEPTYCFEVTTRCDIVAKGPAAIPVISTRCGLTPLQMSAIAAKANYDNCSIYYKIIK